MYLNGVFRDPKTSAFFELKASIAVKKLWPSVSSHDSRTRHPPRTSRSLRRSELQAFGQAGVRRAPAPAPASSHVFS